MSQIHLACLHLLAMVAGSQPPRPLVVCNAASATLRILQLQEPHQRQELSPTDEARAYQELMDLQGLRPRKIALHVRGPVQHVPDRLRVLRDRVLSDAVARRQICAPVAREINKRSDEIAEKRRQRVPEGARLQHKDSEGGRAHRAWDGLVHLRLAPRTDRLSEAVLGGASVFSEGLVGSMGYWGPA